jgi:hypothetical protein
MGIIGKRLVSDFSFEVSIEIPQQYAPSRRLDSLPGWRLAKRSSLTSGR